MKALAFKEHGGIDKLAYQDVPDPQPGPADVLVRVKAAALNPIRGADRAVRYFLGLLRKHEARGGRFAAAPARFNGAPGLVIYLDGVLDQALTIESDGERIAAIYLVRNPEKLARLGM